MSYCRLSSEDFASDVYVYESDEGWVVHVAASRHRTAEPMPAPIGVDPAVDPHGWAAAYLRRHAEVARIIDAAELVAIGGPYDGRSFIEDTATMCADRLVKIVAAGYRVPDGVIDNLRAEHEEMATDA
ncbi:hypothetical protein [Isoptericola croceus]|uniref:hypothetical protein n=1 Tax=Isoptericola croceus TaxID=3031406 RepID=UPI0023F6864C|nr:hypothetical protein [Isoptericola croceus]